MECRVGLTELSVRYREAVEELGVARQLGQVAMESEGGGVGPPFGDENHRVQATTLVLVLLSLGRQGETERGEC